MHELSIAQGIINIALRRGEEVGAKRITCVRVKVGEFTSVVPDSLRSCFELLTEATPAAGAALAVEVVPLAAECSVCHSPFAPENMSFRCPGCGSPDVEIKSGRELYVESIEVE